jgi:hypothetical protein
MRIALAYAGKSGGTLVSSWIDKTFVQNEAAAEHSQLCHAGDQLRLKRSKLADLMDGAEPTYCLR